MTRPEFEIKNPYRFSEIIRYDDEFAEAVEGVPPEHVDAALANSLIANRVIEDAELAKVLNAFAEKYGLKKLAHMIEPNYGFIRQSDNQFHAINTLDLLWFNRDGGPNCQASLAIIDGAKMGGYIGARTEGTLIQQGEVFRSVFQSTMPLPIAPQAANGLLSDMLARRVRETGAALLESKCKTIEALSVLSTQVDLIALNLPHTNPQAVM